MECRYCRALNAEDDHRCERCGRRLRMTPVYTGQSAAAPKLEFEASANPQLRLEPSPTAEETVKPRLQVVAYQPTLFSGRDMPLAVIDQPEKYEIRDARPPSPRPRSRSVLPTGQQTLQFSPTGPTREGEPIIYCDAPVAAVSHRMMAAACDGVIVLIGMGLFVGIFYTCTSLFGGGSYFTINKQTLPFLAGIAILFGVLYNSLWALGNADTPGMAWARLRLVNFEGQKPDREQRIYRLASGCLSVMATGLGVLWALVDEEALTWHDHMSKTFPTPY
jgi:uncharacterized RDD family membrane protein YckC